MNETIAIFESTGTELSNDMMKYGVLTLVFLVLTIGGYFKKVEYDQSNYKNMLLMLGFFACLISAGSTFFSWLNTKKVTPVYIRVAGVETPFGKISYDQIHNAYIHTEELKSKLSSTKVVKRTRFLIIEDSKRRPHTMSEEDYPIDKIFNALEKQIKIIKAQEKAE